MLYSHIFLQCEVAEKTPSDDWQGNSQRSKAFIIYNSTAIQNDYLISTEDLSNNWKTNWITSLYVQKIERVWSEFDLGMQFHYIEIFVI